MSLWLQIPTPAGDLGEIEHAAAGLRGFARNVHEGAADLHRVGSALDSAWSGQAAQAFELKNAAAGAAMRALGDGKAEASRLLDGYANEWRTARDASLKAHGMLESAVSTYLHAAPSALGGVASHLESFLSDAVGALFSLVGDVLGSVRHAVSRVTSWHPPDARPVLMVVGAFEGNPVVTLDNVLHGLQSGSPWGVSHLLDAVHSVAHVVGGAIHGAMNAVHAVEHAFASAVAAAHRLAADALATLEHAAKRAAGAVERLVVDLGTHVFHAVVETIAAGAPFVLAVGAGIVHALHVVDEVALAIDGAVITFEKVRLGLRESRRMQDTQAQDDRAAALFYSSPTYQAQVDTARRLCSSSYSDTGAPAGWDRVQTVHGANGFDAVVFRNPATGEVVVAYRGSGPLNDWGQDSQNAGGFETSQGDQALRLAAQTTSTYGAGHVSFTGHSLGGSLAAMASIATGRPATTFNAAGVGGGNYAAAVAAGHGIGRSEHQITNFRTTDDILTNGQEGLHVSPASGAQVTLASNTKNPVKAHDLDSFNWDDYAHAAGR